MVLRFFIATLLLFVGKSAHSAVSSIEDLISSLNRLKPAYAGPNCFNLSLVANGLVPHLRYTSVAEFNLFINSSFCHSLEVGSIKQTADVGVVWSQAGSSPWQPEHAFVMIDENKIFHKPGQGKTKAYTISTVGQAESEYSTIIANDCESKHIDASECRYETKFYRCDAGSTFEDRIKSAPLEVGELFSKISKFEEALQRKLMEGAPLGILSKTYFVETMKRLVEVLKQSEVISKANIMNKEDREFVFGLLFYRVNAIIEQLNQLIDASDTDGVEGMGIATSRGQLNYYINDLIILNCEIGFSGRIFQSYLNSTTLNGDFLKSFMCN